MDASQEFSDDVEARDQMQSQENLDLWTESSADVIDFRPRKIFDRLQWDACKRP